MLLYDLFPIRIFVFNSIFSINWTTQSINPLLAGRQVPAQVPRLVLHDGPGQQPGDQAHTRSCNQGQFLNQFIRFLHLSIPPLCH